MPTSKPAAPTVQISYCTQCKPPAVVAIALATGSGHNANGKFHKKIKAIPLDPKDAQKPGEAAGSFIERISAAYKAKLK